METDMTVVFPGSHPISGSARVPLEARSAERGSARLRNPLVLVRLHAGDADGADAFVLMNQRHGALDQDTGGKIDKGRPLLDPILEELAGPFGHGRSPCL